MAASEHIAMLEGGVKAWNRWRDEHPEVTPDLTRADLRGADLRAVNFSSADLFRANLSGSDLMNGDLSESSLREANLADARLYGARLARANLRRSTLAGANLHRAGLSQAELGFADLSGADLEHARLTHARMSQSDLSQAFLRDADFTGADLTGAQLERAWIRGSKMIDAKLSGANLKGAVITSTDFTGADLRSANLEHADLVQVDLTRAVLSESRIYGISVWDAVFAETTQTDLIITKQDQPAVHVDNLELAQFIYLLLNNEKVREVIDTITSKTVLILGRFSEEQQVVLDAIRQDLRDRGYVPILFDFRNPSSKDLTGTVEILARMARFIIADLTSAHSVPHELATVVPHLRTTPVLPLQLSGTEPYTMFRDLAAYPWVLDVHTYPSRDALVDSLGGLLESAEVKVGKLRGETG